MREFTKTLLAIKLPGRVLSDAIDEWVLSNFRMGRQQQALLVTGLDLLYRYRLPLSAFIRLANEKNMIILSLSALDANFRPTKPLPTYIQSLRTRL